MAGSDPKSGRASGAMSDKIDAEEDPLVELARIVSEDGGFATPKAEKPKMTTRNESNQRHAYVDGLEAELLQELESSFGGRADSTPRAGPSRSGHAQRPGPRAVDRDPDDLLRSIEEQLGKFEQRHAERIAATSGLASPNLDDDVEETEDLGADEEPEDIAEPALDEEPLVDEPAETWASRRVSRLRPLDIEDEREAPASIWDEEPEEVPARIARTNYHFRGQAHAEWDRDASEPSYVAAPAPRVEPQRAEPERAEFRRAEPPQVARRVESLPGFGDDEPSDAELFAPHGRATRAHDPFVKAEPVRETREDDPVAAETLRRRRIADAFPEFDEDVPARDEKDERAAINARLAEALESDFPDSSYEKPWESGEPAPRDEPRVAMAAVPAASRRAAAARAHAAQRGRGLRTALITVAGVVVVVLIGGAAALYLRSTESGPAIPPPVIAADAEPVKVEPPKDQAATEGETVGEAVYNRVAGNTPPADEKVVDNAEEPRDVARIVLPSPQSEGDGSVVRPVGDGTDTANAASEQPAATDELGPRRVPTFTVRPDGTIVANSEDATGGEQQTASAAPTAPAETPPASAEMSTGAVDAEAPAPTADAMAPDSTSVQPTDLAAVAAPPPVSSESEPPVDLLTGSNTPAPEPTPAAAPVSLPASSESVPEGYLVQVSSQRSMDQAQASYADIQQQYASVLGKLNPVIQEADLGTKGIYYRVRVGPWASRDDAIKVCEALKAAGGNCFVTQ